MDGRVAAACLRFRLAVRSGSCSAMSCLSSIFKLRKDDTSQGIDVVPKNPASTESAGQVEMRLKRGKKDATRDVSKVSLFT